jgi:hypothetical protein
MSIAAIAFVVVNGMFVGLLCLTLHMATRGYTSDDIQRSDIIRGIARSHSQSREIPKSVSMTDRFKRFPFGVRFAAALAAMFVIVAVRQTLFPGNDVS